MSIGRPKPNTGPKPAKGNPFGGVPKRQIDPKSSRRERKYEKLTGRNPRLGRKW